LSVALLFFNCFVCGFYDIFKTFIQYQKLVSTSRWVNLDLDIGDINHNHLQPGHRNKQDRVRMRKRTSWQIAEWPFDKQFLNLIWKNPNEKCQASVECLTFSSCFPQQIRIQSVNVGFFKPWEIEMDIV
jgi:hypothetical protein